MVSGIIAGFVGGIIIGFLSSSSLSVSGPAAGLTTIVLASIQQLGSFESFLTAVVLAGIFQFILGLVKAGTIGNYFPNAVIKGMLAAIGLILVLKQIPHLFGYDSDFEGDESFFQPDGQNTFTELLQSIYYVNPYIALIGVISIIILLIFESPKIKNSSWQTYIPGPLVVVLFGVIAVLTLRTIQIDVQPEHLVSLPVFNSLSKFQESLASPDFSSIANPQVWIVAHY
jgi:MFS superfamily sulfate permease-like transporter